MYDVIAIFYVKVDGKLQEVYKTYLSHSERVREAQKKLTKALKAHHQNLMESTKMPADEAAVASTYNTVGKGRMGKGGRCWI